ncbi:MAG TPA: M14 family zinc carboxypeptidase [Gemmatimonadaceae bacterium]|nr:M14 family zinc carboxypeptidase [Gemmatimonadaceae bacterium]
MLSLTLILTAAAVFQGPASAYQAPAPAPQAVESAKPKPGPARATLDTGYARLVREATTDPRFLPQAVATLPASETVPSPLKYFGSIAGAPGVMHYTKDLYAYFRALAKATPRVRVDSIATTEEGRPIVLVVIADDATMRNLDHYKALMRRLADPRVLPADSAQAVIGEAKPIYYLNGGLHSPEMGSPEMLTELAYRLAVGDDSTDAMIRDHVITIINPVSEPDGRDKQVDWYLHYTKGRPKFDDGFPRSSPVWGRYALHDNNRDGLQISLALTKAIFDIYYDWHPLVMHDLHESVPLLYVSTGTGPYNVDNDPIIIGEWQVLANNDITTMSAAGLPGVWTWGFFDGWWPGYGMWVANNHNSVGRFFETFGNDGGDTYLRDLSDERYAGAPVTSREWYRSWPPTKKVYWSSRDNVNYQETGVLASLTYAATNASKMLHDFYQVGVNSLARGRSEMPHAYVIPGFARQRDPRRVAYLINQLERQHIEIAQRTTGDSSGDFVIQLNQPYRDLAVNLLSTQSYPSTAQYPPYDDIAWTLGALYGVDVRAVNDTAVLHWTGLQALHDTVAFAGAVRGSGPVYLLAYRAQSEVLPALFHLRERDHAASAAVAEHAFVVGTDSFPAGSVVIEHAGADAARDLATRWGLPLVSTDHAPQVPTHPVSLPRIAIYHSWYDTQDAGWSRYTFDQLGIPYVSIDKDDLRRGDLRKRFDVILVPNMGGSLDRMINGVNRDFSPLPFQKTSATPNLGTPFASPDITGGPGFAGLAALRAFVDDGGEIITLETATRLVAESGIASALSPHNTRTLFHPGSVVRVRERHASPILYGFPDTTTVFRGNGPLYEVLPRDSAMLILQYGTKRPAAEETGPIMGEPNTATAPAPHDSTAAKSKSHEAEEPYVVSGMVRGQDEIVGQGAIFDVPVRHGHVVAFTFDPLHRYLNHHEFPLVWNAIINWNVEPTARATR